MRPGNWVASSRAACGAVGPGPEASGVIAFQPPFRNLLRRDAMDRHYAAARLASAIQAFAAANSETGKMRTSPRKNGVNKVTATRNHA